MSIGAFGENFPYTNYHNLNLDWIIKTVLNMDIKLDKAISSKITVANPIQWDISKQYEAFTIVMDNDNAYLSMQAVPYGIAISNTAYWNKIFDLSELFTSIKNAISFNDDGTSPTSSSNRDEGSLVWLDDKLYKVTSAIAQGDIYSNSNVAEVSIEELLETVAQTMSTLSNTVSKVDSRTQSAREFILVGDSFGGGVDGNDNTHAVTGGGWIERFKTAVTGWAKVYNNQIPLGGVYGFASSRPFLDVLQDAEQYITDKTKITDIVVLGGTNDISQSPTAVRLAIEAFVDYCHTNYPKARVAIGCIGTNVNAMVNTMGPIYRHCVSKGAEYISDLRALFCLTKYIGTDGVHLTQAGYEYYQPFITEAILTGHSSWKFIESNTSAEWLTISSAFSTNHNTIRLSYTITNNTWMMALMGTNNQQGGQGIANAIPVDATATNDIVIATQNVVKVLEPYARFQTLLAIDKGLADLYMTANGDIHIQRPYGLSSALNCFAVTLAKPYGY